MRENPAITTLESFAVALAFTDLAEARKRSVDKLTDELATVAIANHDARLRAPFWRSGCHSEAEAVSSRRFGWHRHCAENVPWVSTFKPTVSPRRRSSRVSIGREGVAGAV